MSQVVVSERTHVNRMGRMQAAPIVLIGPTYIVAYVLLDWLSIISSTPSFGIVPWSPETGLLFAAFLIFGRQLWLYVLVALAVSNLLLRSELPPSVQILSPIIVGGGYALALNWLQQSRWQLDIKLASFRDILVLEGIAIASATFVAMASVASLTAAGMISPSEIPYNIFRYALGDLIGVSIVTPFLLILANVGGLPRITFEAAMQGLAILAALVFAFGFTSLPHFRLFNLMFFPIIWIALRHGLKGAALGLVVTEVGLVVALLILGPQLSGITTYQSLMLVLAFTGLAIGGLVTDRRRFEQELRLNQESVSQIFRLGSAGEVTTAIAHEINQPLTAISNYTRLVQEYLVSGLGDKKVAIEAASKVASQVERTAEVVRNLRDFIRLGRRQIGEESPHLLIREVLDLLEPNLQRAGASVKVAIARDIRNAAVDRLQIEQVLMNIISNAVEAMIDNDSSRERLINIGARNIIGNRIEIDVADSGPGFPPDFDLRKSGIRTSSKKDGLGVGLSLSRTIIEGHGGELLLSSNDKGALVRIRLKSIPRGAEQ
ncbi:MASE1 domain-containing protein [Hyphomicrobium sp.]|uniref:MASE1 domain-containing protein n=1 Tax=Hyphomicrobium sp. TaxID=82 RepID=UPI0035613C29